MYFNQAVTIPVKNAQYFLLMKFFRGICIINELFQPNIGILRCCACAMVELKIERKVLG